MSEFLIDLSRPLNEATPPFPGDAPVEVSVLDSTEYSTQAERHLNCSRIGFSVHCGTHMDAPFHFFGERATIDQVPLAAGVGPCALVRLGKLAPEAEITVNDLAPWEHSLRRCKRLILDTGWAQEWDGGEQYFLRHPVICGETARWLVDCGVQLIGVDFPSVDRPPYPAHLVLLGNDVLIVENLCNLDAVPADEFELMTIPLKLTGRDGSPVRAVARDLTR